MRSDIEKVLLVTCQDQPGLIYKISGVLYGHGYNVISNREYVDRDRGLFFMRTEFSAELNDRKELEREVSSVLPDGATVRLAADQKKKIVVMASSDHHCLAEILIRNRYGEFNAEVSAVISNHEDLAGLAAQFSIPFHCIPNHDKPQEVQEAEVLERLAACDPDQIVLAKYMRILSPEFVDRYAGRIINIHHSFLPAFVGANPYRQAFDRGVKIIGATAHFVTKVLDEGPIICQQVIPIDHTLDVRAMRQAGRDIEKAVLVDAIRLVADDKVFINGNKTIVFD